MIFLVLLKKCCILSIRYYIITANDKTRAYGFPFLFPEHLCISFSAVYRVNLLYTTNLSNTNCFPGPSYFICLCVGKWSEFFESSGDKMVMFNDACYFPGTQL